MADPFREEEEEVRSDELEALLKKTRPRKLGSADAYTSWMAALPFPDRKNEMLWLKGHELHNKARAEITKRFRDWLEKDAKTTEWHEKIRQKFWDMAWERGHSAGFEEVSGEYREIAQLVVEVMDVLMSPDA